MRIERIGDAVLYHGDALEILPTLPKVDLVLTDPPYMNMGDGVEINFDTGVAATRIKSKTVADPWGANLDWVDCAFDLCRYGFFAFCSYHFVSELLVAVPSKPTCLITWYQRNAMPSAANAPHFQTEFCWAFRKESGLNWRSLKTHYNIPRLQTGCMAVERILNADGSTAHPTQKPVKLMEEILCIGGDTILDPFMGSGTTGVSCANLGRKFIGIEIEEKYFNIACERITAAYAQGRLFE